MRFKQAKHTTKRDILIEKRENGMALKKLEFTPESGNVDTYDCCGHALNNITYGLNPMEKASLGIRTWKRHK